MEFIVTSRDGIEEGLVVRSPYVVISIRDPGTPKPRIRRGAGFRDLLSLEFHDAEPSETLDLPDDVELMTTEHAREIWGFVDRWRGEVGAIVCHCEQGMSRSPAVAIGVCIGLGEDPSQLIAEFSPNAFVQQLVVGHLTR